MVLSEELCILSSCFLSPMSKNSVLEELIVRRLADWFVFATPTSVGRSVWICSCGDRNCSRRSTVRLGIDTLIANIPVMHRGGLSLVIRG